MAMVEELEIQLMESHKILGRPLGDILIFVFSLLGFFGGLSLNPTP